VGHAEQVAKDSDGLEGLGGIQENVGPLSQKSDKIGSMLLGQKVEVGVDQVVNIQLRLAGH
jgi:hypothetical protein